MTAMRPRKAILIAVVGWLAVSLAGCLFIYIPKFGERVSEADIAFLEKASTTRQEVIQKLGEPTIINATNLAIYQWRTTRSYFVGGEIAFSRISSRLLVEFDQIGGLTAYTYSRNTLPPILVTYEGITRVQINLSDRVSYDRIVTTSFCGKSSSKNWCTSFDLSPDGSYVAIAGTHKNSLLLHNVATGQERPLQGESAIWTKRGLYNVTFSPNGAFVGAAGVNKARSRIVVVVWNVLTGEPVFVHEVSGEPQSWNEEGATILAFSPDGKILSTGSLNGVLQLWEVMSGREIVSVKIADAPIQSIAWSPDAELLAVGTTRGDLIVARPNGRDSAILIPGSKSLRHGRNVLFSPDGETLLTNNCINIGVWDVREIKVLLDAVAGQNSASKQLPPKSAWLLPYGFQDSNSCLPALSLSRDGNVLAALSSKHMITLWDRHQKRLIAVLNASKDKDASSRAFWGPHKRAVWGPHKDLSVSGLELSGDGSLVATMESSVVSNIKWPLIESTRKLPRIKLWNINKLPQRGPTQSFNKTKKRGQRTIFANIRKKEEGIGVIFLSENESRLGLGAFSARLSFVLSTPPGVRFLIFRWDARRRLRG